jgi:ABC-2 type transport system permease protein
MPLLLIFMCSTITMRQWSEERRTGTLEHVLTQPAPLWAFVVGKFLGCLWLLCVALLVTLPLPITVSIIGDLDWGPVLAGCIATLFLGAAYLSIGLFVSSRSSNQIVSLILSVALCGVFYLIGSDALTGFFGNTASEWLRLAGAGSRFDSITRGVVDLRDIYYYISIVAVFLALNTYFLERERWSSGIRQGRHRNWQMITALLVVNFLAANLWLGQLNKLRVDTTAGDQYSISSATRNYLQQLQEPLLLRGYFSSKTHPLLAPLVPQVRDLIREYEIAGNGRVLAGFIDPLSDPEMEQEANEQYGIEPVPFQVADRYQSSIVSSYFNVLVQYGNENVVLGFQDLIDVKASGSADLDVKLRNPEHDLTRAIKKVLTSYQAGGNLFDTVKGDLEFTAYLSDPSRMPQQLAEFSNVVMTVADKYKKQSDNRLAVVQLNPDDNNGAVAQQIARDFGFRPMAAGLFSNERFYFHMTLRKDDQIVQIPLDDMTEGGFDRNLQAAIKRFATGFTKTVAMAVPPTQPSPYGQMPSEFSQLQNFLGGDLNVINEDLSDGRVSGEADILLLLAPENLDEKSGFAVDQFLMQGGTVIVSTAPYNARFSRQRIDLAPRNSGLEDWLAHHGFELGSVLVMDPQNAAFPVPVTRKVGGLQLQEMRMINYPYFVDVRSSGLNADNPVTSQLPQVTMAWSSPLTIDADANAEREVTTLLSSSGKSWLSESTDIMPRLERGGVAPYRAEGETGSHTLAAVAAGRFTSLFEGKESPLLSEAQEDDNTDDSGAPQQSPVDTPAAGDEDTLSVTSVIERSPESSRLMVFASNDFVKDQILQMAGSATGTVYLAPMQLMANAVDWSLEDTGLMGIRGRGQFNRTLPPMEKRSQLFWEYTNYVLAALAVLLIAFIYRMFRGARQARQSKLILGEEV